MNILGVAGLLLILCGAVMMLRARWLSSPDHPIQDGSAGVWNPLVFVFKYTDRWQGNGYRWYVAGMVVFTIGLVLNAVAVLTG